MPAIWHDSGVPSFLAPRPLFSFHDLAQIECPAPYTYEIAMQVMRAREQRLGVEFFEHNARRARAVWDVKKPWWVSL